MTELTGKLKVLEAEFIQQKDELKTCFKNAITEKQKGTRFWNLLVLYSSIFILLTGLSPIVINLNKMPETYIYCILTILPLMGVIYTLLIFSLDKGEVILNDLDAYLIKHGFESKF